jgi:hypothetical protein
MPQSSRFLHEYILLNTADYTSWQHIYLQYRDNKLDMLLKHPECLQDRCTCSSWQHIYVQLRITPVGNIYMYMLQSSCRFGKPNHVLAEVKNSVVDTHKNITKYPECLQDRCQIACLILARESKDCVECGLLPLMYIYVQRTREDHEEAVRQMP